MELLSGASKAIEDVPPTTLGYALLALLAREPLTGYELTQQMRDPISLFWEPRHSQIYPELARLERLELLTATSEPGPGPRPKRTYSITSRGVATLRDWVGQPPRLGGRRDELLLKVYASWVAEPSVVLALVREGERHHAAQLELYLARAASARRRGVHLLGPSDPNFADYATLRRGIGFERGRLAWCRWLIKQLEGSASDAGPAGSASVIRTDADGARPARRRRYGSG